MKNTERTERTTQDHQYVVIMANVPTAICHSLESARQAMAERTEAVLRELTGYTSEVIDGPGLPVTYIKRNGKRAYAVAVVAVNDIRK